MKLSKQLTVLNVSSVLLILYMVFILLTTPKNQGGDQLNNFFPVVLIIVGVFGLIMDQILQVFVQKKATLNMIGAIIVGAALLLFFYIINN